MDKQAELMEALSGLKDKSLYSKAKPQKKLINFNLHCHRCMKHFSVVEHHPKIWVCDGCGSLRVSVTSQESIDHERDGIR